MHRKHALFRHQIVHDGEDALLHLARVLGAEYDELFALQREIDTGGRRHLLSVSVCGELPGVIDHVVGVSERCQFPVWLGE